MSIPMKNLHFLIAFAAIIALTITACQKDNSEELAPPDADLSLEDQALSTGVQFMPEAEYNRLPVANPLEIPSLMPTDATSDRAAYRLLATPPVGNQGGEGSCTAWATAYCVSSYYMRIFNKDWAYTNAQAVRSPEFLYNATKVNSSCASGAYMNTVLNYMKSTGVCAWSQMPYTDSGCSTLPNASQKSQAAVGKLASWQTVAKTVTAVKDLINLGYPLLVAFDVNTNFKTQTFNAPYTYKSFNNAGYTGGHVVTIVGYDDDKQRLILQNSWGTGRHDNGFFYVSYSFFPSMAKELYVAVPVFPTFTVRHASAVGDVTFNVNGKDYLIKKGQTLSVPGFLNTNAYFMWECLWQNNAWACKWDGDYKPVYGKKYKIIDMSQNWDMKLVAE